MHRAGADLMVSKSVARQTASARQTDRTESMSTVQTIIDSLERALEDAYELAGKWIGVDASGVNVNIAPEFGIGNDFPNPAENLSALGLSEDDLLAELKRRGLVSEQVTSLDPQNTLAPQNNELGNTEDE